MYLGFVRSPKHIGSMIKEKDSSSHYTRLSSDGDNHETRKGYVPVMVGSEGVKEKFMVPIEFIKHPSIVAMLELSADEFGYKQEGVIQIPCEPECFREIINKLPKKR
ncbi:hypothetical protein Ancab_007506 [Ancistrocladus abbreviatus]